ncbi:MAG: hypothetical protein K0R14_1728 [Burkholderiales bacterium]|jgi:hypothetical protein|nr:hypothetical protein [Burkholderiales bacterium]
MRKLIYLLGMFTLLLSSMKLTYGETNEYGLCTVKIRPKEGAEITKYILWRFVNNRLEISNDNGIWEIYSDSKLIKISSSTTNNFLIGEFPLIELPGLTDMNDPSDISKRRYLKFKKSSIQDKENKDNRKNVMEFGIVTSSDRILDENKVTKSKRYTIAAEQSGCRIRYEKATNGHGKTDDRETTYVEHLPGATMSNYLATKWWNTVGAYQINTKISTNFVHGVDDLVPFLPKNPKGVCFFDMDGTLSQNADGDKNQQVIWACLERGFLVGIITASQRNIDQTFFEPFISYDLYRLILLHDSYMYNNYSMRSGQDAATDLATYEDKEDENKNTILNSGYKKAYQVHYWRNKYFPEMPDKCVVLFDDTKVVIDQYIDYGKNMSLIRPKDGVVDTNKHNFSSYWTTVYNQLTAQNVAAKVSNLIKDGCNTGIKPASFLAPLSPSSGEAYETKTPLD